MPVASVSYLTYQCHVWQKVNLIFGLTAAYMAPERIDPTGNPGQYDIRSDVWSFGISMVEMATGKFPYSTWVTPFEQLKQVPQSDIIPLSISVL